MSSRGLSVAAVNSNTTAAVKSGIFKGEYSLIFFTPELLLQERRWRDLLNSKIYVHRLKGFVVDEAHCVKKWYVTDTATYNYVLHQL